ncbi:MAG: septum formation initiator family protein [Actinobacteria bacterium]|nr:septum formation initiator family protein [Actinomycetota bacterium]
MAHTNRLKSRFRLGAVVLLLGALALTGLAPARRAYEQRQQLAVEKEHLAALIEQNRALESRLDRLDDPAYAEKLVREELGLARPGDTVFVMPPQVQTIELTSEQTDPGDGGPIEWIKDQLGLE